MPSELVVRADRAEVPLETDSFAGEVVRRSPLVVVHDGMLELAGRQHVIDLGAAAERTGGEGTKHDHTGFSVELPVWDDPVLSTLAAAIDDLVGIDTRAQRTARFRRYRPGESHPGHFDHFSTRDDELLVTAMVVLEEPQLGGATHFPHAAPVLRLPARAGRLVLWVNHLRDGGRDLLTRHAGEVVEEGEKITLTRFLYGSPSLAAQIWDRLGA